jgi:hypothetical protein
VGRRYVEVLTDNLGQPGFREVLVAVHDVDSRRDLIGAILAPQARGRFEARRSTGGPREAEIVDFSGPQRNLALDFLLGALRVPIANAPWPVQFPADGYWRGELHHVCDRPELPIRLLEENLGHRGRSGGARQSGARSVRSAHLESQTRGIPHAPRQ